MSIFKKTLSISNTFPTIFWYLISATFLNQIGNMAMVFLVIFLAEFHGYSLAQASLAFAFYTFSIVLSGFVSGHFIDRIGAARITIMFLFLNGLVLFFFLFIKAYFVILLVCLIWGLTTGFYRASSQTFVSLLATSGNQKVAFSIYRLAINLGMSIGPAIGGYFATHAFRSIFIMNGCFNILAGLLLYFGLKRTGWLSHRPLAVENTLPLEFLWFYRDRVLRIFLIGLVPISMVFYQHASTFSVFLYQDLHLSLSFYGLLFTLNTLLIVFFELPLNVATLSWPAYRSLVLGSFLITIGFAGLFFATSPTHVIVLTLFWTLGEMILYPCASAFIAELAHEEHRGRYMAIYSLFSNLGLFLGPLLGALVLEKFTSQGLWLACGLWGLVSMILFAFVILPPAFFRRNA